MGTGQPFFFVQAGSLAVYPSLSLTAMSRPKKPSPLPHIIPELKDWPIHQLNNDKPTFLRHVADAVFEKLTAGNQRSSITDVIAKALYLEEARMKTKSWSVDARDERTFWNSVKRSLLELTEEGVHQESSEELLRKIIDRYAHEIAGRFKPSTYRFAKRLVPLFLARLLNASARRRGIRYLVDRNRVSIYDKITLTGPVESIRNVAKNSTVVIVPTHFSNIDSLVMGWVIEAIGLPAFLYGAGLNLFNIRLLGYFMNRLGAYKVDRRKKNSIYLETLNAYSTLALRKGAHSLFFPGGTRSRSGMLEEQLRLGLLATTIEAQRLNFSEGAGRKIVIVPAVISYHFVLEAPALIEQYLAATGKEKYYSDTDRFSTSYKLARLILKVFTTSSDFTVSFGTPIDVFGNRIDDSGQSIDANGNVIEISRYFSSGGVNQQDEQRDAEYNKLLAQKIIEQFHRHNVVLSSHLVAFVAFELLRKEYPKLDLYEFLRLPEEQLSLSFDAFAQSVERVRTRLAELRDSDEIKLSPAMDDDLNGLIKYGLKKVGVYHSKKPLLKSKDGRIITKSSRTLYYYRNRLNGFGLEQYV